MNDKTADLINQLPPNERKRMRASTEDDNKLSAKVIARLEYWKNWLEKAQVKKLKNKKKLH